ncbi:MAG: T9SS type A sorting domain-containing protein [Candidatus Goldbacteria bacterium]|nr:T9SS type A sorting domain-containing protein [Candidatus Goldiibacteriota bacterium]
MKIIMLIYLLFFLFMDSYANYNQAIYIMDTGNNRIQKYSLNSEFILLWGQYGKEPGMFISPSSVAISRDGNYIYVVDTANNRIQKFTSSGEFLTLWGGPNYGTVNGMFASPSCIAVNFENGQDFIYVADTGNNRIQKFDSYGNWISNITGFNNPQGITADYNFNYLYVADTGNNKIKKYDIRGNLIQEWGGYGITPGKFRYPRDLAVDKNNKIYVADGLNYRIQKFTSEGVFELLWGSKGSNNGQFLDHFGVAVDNDNNVYVADAGNNRIQKFTENGQWISSIGNINQGFNPGEFYYPQGIEVYIERPLIYPTEIINTPTQEEITPTLTFTWTTNPTETFTSTVIPTREELIKENLEESENTPTFTPTDIMLEIETPVAIETEITPFITPTSTDKQCELYYSIEYNKKKYFHGKFIKYKNFMKKYNKNIWNEKISIYENECGGYIYEFEMYNLKIYVYDISGCYLDEIEELIAMKNKFRKGHFYSWFIKKCMKKSYYGIDKIDEMTIISVVKNILKDASVDYISKTTDTFEELDETNTFNYPNPFKDRTTIRFSLDKPQNVKIIISDINGKIIWQKYLMSYETRQGVNYLEWTGVNDYRMRISNGTYIYRIITDEKIVVKKFVILK